MSEQTTVRTEPEKRKRFTLPSAYTILFALIVLAAIATWFVPAGTYDQNRRGEPIPGTYHEVESSPADILVDSLTAPINGLYGIENKKGNINYYNSGTLFGAIDVALFIIVIGGFLGVTMKTGAIQAGIGRLVLRLRGKERLMIPLLMTVFAIGGTTYGMAEESLAFYALVITVMIAAGYDSITGAADRAARVRDRDPRIHDQPVRDGDRLRVRRHPDQRRAGRSARHPDRRSGDRHLLRDALRGSGEEGPLAIAGLRHEGRERGALQGRGRGAAVAAMTGKQKTILVVFGLAFVVMMYGVIPWEDLGVPIPTLWWWFPEMTASFILFAIVIGIIGRMKEGDLTSTFVDGARDLLGVALIIGIARGITVIMNNGEITDTVLHWAEVALGDVGAAAFAIVMFLLFLPLSFLIPSSSGLATVAMPIMAPLAVFVGVSEALVVTVVPERFRTHEPVHPDLGGRDGWAGDRAGAVRAVPEMGLATARHARRAHGDRARRRGGPVVRPDLSGAW